MASFSRVIVKILDLALKDKINMTVPHITVW